MFPPLPFQEHGEKRLQVVLSQFSYGLSPTFQYFSCTLTSPRLALTFSPLPLGLPTVLIIPHPPIPALIHSRPSILLQTRPRACSPLMCEPRPRPRHAASGPQFSRTLPHACRSPPFSPRPPGPGSQEADSRSYCLSPARYFARIG